MDTIEHKRMQVDKMDISRHGGQKWIKVDNSGHKWTQLDTHGRKWTHLNASGHKWTKVDTSGISGHNLGQLDTI